jgi:hypothetical protein
LWKFKNCSSAARLVVAFAGTVAFVKQKRLHCKFSGGDWVTGQPKPLFATFASALLAGI